MSDFYRTHLGQRLAQVVIDSLPKIANELKRANDLKEEENKKNWELTKEQLEEAQDESK